MLIEAIVGVNVAVAQETTTIKDAFTKLTESEKRSIYLETLTEAELQQIESSTARLNRASAVKGDPYWCLRDDELFKVMVDTCGPEPRQNPPD